jgi:hypothetical protein
MTNESTLLKIYQATLRRLERCKNYHSTATMQRSTSNSAKITKPILASNIPEHWGNLTCSVSIEIPDGTFRNSDGGKYHQYRETFPMITKNNELYFSSGGHPGLGV